MRILLYTDNHFCMRSSIINQIGDTFSKRLENQIQSIEWAEQLASTENCSKIICLGDFFDKDHLTDIEITAFYRIKFNNNVSHAIVVGNHESSVDGLRYSTSECLRSANFDIYSNPSSIIIDNTQLCFLPYITESNRKSINEYFGEKPFNTKRIIFSHNDIAGIQMGPVISKSGFIKEDIEANCDLFLNGHLHNGIYVTDKILNLGNLTGKDFGEDAFRYRHCAFILDTDSLKITQIENPFAFNFYQLDINSIDDFSKIDVLKNNAVCSIKCKSALTEDLKIKLYNSENIFTFRIISTLELLDNPELNSDDLKFESADYLSKFDGLVRSKLDNSILLNEELLEICKNES